MKLAAKILVTAVLCAPMAADAGDVRSLLEKSKGTRVSLRLAGGEELAGKVASVGDDTVHLSELAGREFFDAVVVIDDIAAVVYRAQQAK